MVTVRPSSTVALLILGAALALVARAGAEPGPDPDSDEAVLKQADIPTSGPGLLAYFRQLPRPDRTDFGRLIRQLGSDSFQEREQATQALIASGRPALPALRNARGDPDLEIARRGASCIATIERGERKTQPHLVAAAVRLLVRHAPAGAVAALLGYLPAAPPGEIEEEVWFGLDALATKAGTLDPSLLAAVRDGVPARRAAAACLVGRLGDAPQKAAVRKLLTDPDPGVRLRAAQGLLAGGDTSGLRALVELLAEPATEVAWQAEELLHWSAGETAPEPTVGARGAEARRQCRQAWETWLKEHGAAVEPARLLKEPGRPGLLLVCNDEEAYVCGCDGHPRWRLSGTFMDAQLLPGGRVLVAEAEGPQPGAWEDDLTGDVLWEPKLGRVSHLIAYRRLRNGNTLLATNRAVFQLTPDGIVEHRSEHQHFGMAHLGQRRDGSLVTLAPFSSDGSAAVWVLDPVSGHGRKLFPLRGNPESYDSAQVEPLPDGSYLVFGNRLGKVLAVDATGKSLWQVQLEFAVAAPTPALPSQH